MIESLPSQTLGELVELQTEKAFSEKDLRLPYVGLEHIAQGAPKLLGTAESKSSISVNSRFRKDDILFGKLRPNLKKSLRAPFDGYCSTDILVLRCREGVLPAFAGHVFQWDYVFGSASATAAGTKMPRTSWSELRRLRVFAPGCEVEQSRIAGILDTIDDAIAKTEEVTAKLQQVRAGLLHDLLTRGLDENGELRDPFAHPEHFHDSSLGRLPSTWSVRTIEDCCSDVVDCPHSTPTFRDTGVLVARTMHIKEGQFDERAASRVSEAEYLERIARLQPQPGDVIFTREAPVGEAFVVPDGMRICLGQRVMLFRPRRDELVGSYLVAQIYSGAVKRRIDARTGGTTNPHLNVAEVRKFPIPIPRLAEQESVMEAISASENDISAENLVLRKLHALRLGLMTDLLTGRVRVPELILAVEAHV